MKIWRVLLWTKRSFYELFGGNKGLQNAPASQLERIRRSHEETVRAREKVREVLFRAHVRLKEPKRLGRIEDGRFDLVVVVGGDGTVLDVARHVGSTPVIAVNSSPSTSVGHFCRTSAEGFEEVIRKVIEGEEKPIALTRIRTVVDGVAHKYPALNDVLFAHRVPAATSRYIIHVGGDAEEQKSSGVWVSTAAGSSGAIRSAGGQIMNLEDSRLQYFVREPFVQSTPGGQPYRLVRGFVGPEGIKFTSRMIMGALYFDGRRVALPVGYGSVVVLLPDAPPLRLYLLGRR